MGFLEIQTLRRLIVLVSIVLLGIWIYFYSSMNSSNGITDRNRKQFTDILLAWSTLKLDDSDPAGNLKTLNEFRAVLSNDDYRQRRFKEKIVDTLYRSYSNLLTNRFGSERGSFNSWKDFVRNITYVFNYPDFCTDENQLPVNVFLLNVVVSRDSELSRRQLIRNTWGRCEVSGYDIKTIFIIGNSEDSKVTDAVFQESLDFGDTVQVGIIESDILEPLKIQIGLEWMQRYCPEAAYILLGHDDEIVNIHKVVEYLSSVKNTPFYGNTEDRNPTTFHGVNIISANLVKQTINSFFEASSPVYIWKDGLIDRAMTEMGFPSIYIHSYVFNSEKSDWKNLSNTLVVYNATSVSDKLDVWKTINKGKCLYDAEA
ncbi:uncharacterized protein LOC117113825 [Anneissia japonica]|uniref:uncharacterized protein LOC117113825 n=1 Tax=Anneissia japonica TaxID=1529436 RepID=UPI001425B381|nr:uncharacterized protein LOC117113825 [Anneissia japonica]